jgi:dienelactone hydrolase
VNSEHSRRDFVKHAAVGTFAAASTMNANSAEAPASRPTTTPDELRTKLVECLGGDWPKSGALNIELHETVPKDGYRIESLSYEVEPEDRVPAMLLVPDGASAAKPAPAVAVWHQHAGQYHLGKTEPAGLAGDPMHHTGVALVREGYLVLCPDALAFEERQDPTGKLKGSRFERFEFLRYVVNGKSMAWKNVLDMRRAIDVLCARPEVKPDRIGCYGHSMGSTHSWLVGPHEPRIRATVGNCCLPTYSAIHEHHLLHCFPNFVPGWLEYGDTPEMAALIAPRALHLNLGESDGGSPIEHAREGVRRIEAEYRRQGVAEQFSSFIEPDTGHVLSPAMWHRTREFLARHLRG